MGLFRRSGSTCNFWLKLQSETSFLHSFRSTEWLFWTTSDSVSPGRYSICKRRPACCHQGFEGLENECLAGLSSTTTFEGSIDGHMGQLSGRRSGSGFIIEDFAQDLTHDKRSALLGIHSSCDGLVPRFAPSGPTRPNCLWTIHQAELSTKALPHLFCLQFLPLCLIRAVAHTLVEPATPAISKNTQP